jgi:hypothetical protein
MFYSTDGKSFATLEELQRYYVELTKEKYPNFGKYDGRAADLIIGKKYRDTGFDGIVTLARVYNINKYGNGAADVFYRGVLYGGSTLTLYDV